jgi:hypothetical protein
MRGFIGVAFHVQPDGAHFDMFHLRPVNARVDDPLVRNHTTQSFEGAMNTHAAISWLGGGVIPLNLDRAKTSSKPISGQFSYCRRFTSLRGSISRRWQV